MVGQVAQATTLEPLEIDLLRRELVSVAQRHGLGPDAEDVVQDCMVALLCGQPATARAYAFGALYRRIALHWRQSARRRVVGLDSVGEADLVRVGEEDMLHSALSIDGALALAVDGLPRVHLVVAPATAHHWASVVVDAVDGLVREVGDQTAVSPRHARRLRHALLEMLREQLGRVEVSLRAPPVTLPPAQWVEVRGLHPAEDHAALRRRCVALAARFVRGRR